jgi:hypothetical protein
MRMGSRSSSLRERRLGELTAALGERIEEAPDVLVGWCDARQVRAVELGAFPRSQQAQGRGQRD